jgi:hypothetical protein
MSDSQTPLDYKEYFYGKFTSLFKSLIENIINILPNSSQEYQDINKLAGLLDKLNFDKIITKMSSNSKLIEALLYLSKNNFNDEICNKILNSNDKHWTIMPSFTINKILLLINNEHKENIKVQINNLHICAVTYNKVIEQISTCKDGETFNPFDSVGKVAENMDINTLFDGVEVKNISAYEMLMESIINQQMDNKMSDYMSNIKEDDVNEAAAKLTDVLNSDSFQGTKQTTKILSDMLNNIKTEVIGLKDEGDKMKGKQGVEQLLGIAQKVAGNMMGTIRDSNVNVLDIWDATSNLAKNTVQSDALNIVDNLIRSNIENNLKQAQNIKNNQNVNTDNTTENTDKKDKTKRREHRKSTKK